MSEENTWWDIARISVVEAWRTDRVSGGSAAPPAAVGGNGTVLPEAASFELGYRVLGRPSQHSLLSGVTNI